MFRCSAYPVAAHAPRGKKSQVESMKTHIRRLPLSKQDGVTFRAENWVSYDTAGFCYCCYCALTSWRLASYYQHFQFILVVLSNEWYVELLSLVPLVRHISRTAGS